MEYSEDDLLGLINGEDPEKENLTTQLDEKINDIDRVLDVSCLFQQNIYTGNDQLGPFCFRGLHS